MKYTKEQAKRLKDKGMNGYNKHQRPLKEITIKDGCFIIESKMNTSNNKLRKSL